MNRKNDSSANDIRRSAERMKHARNSPDVSPLRGFSAFGVIGWSIAVPTVIGAFLGKWLNGVAPQNFSWPIALIPLGAVIGGLIAWNWINKETLDPQADDKKSQATDAKHKRGDQ